MRAGETVFTKRLLWCEIGGTALHAEKGVYKGYSGRATKCEVAFCTDELECWHCKKLISYGSDYAKTLFETFCLDCVTETEPEPQFQVEKRDLGYG